MKNLIVTLALASGAAAASATEYTNFEIPPSTKTRAEVRAQIGLPNENGIAFVGEATVFTPAPAGLSRARTYATTPRDQRINTRNASHQSADLAGRI